MKPTRHNGITRMVVKAMGIFGGVQMANIVCSVVRTKLVSLWLGPAGVGLFGLWNSALDMINTGANLGIRTSSVRDITTHATQGNAGAVARIVHVVRSWSLWLGLIGALLTIAMAPVLSRITFGDTEHIWGFVMLSASVLMLSLTGGEHAVLQGTQRLGNLARASVYGSVAGLVVSVPMFYYWRIDSVVPSIVAYSLAGMVSAYVLRNREVPAVTMPRSQVVAMGKGFVSLGIYMTIGTFLSILASYVISTYINLVGGEVQLGYYQTGYTLVNRYVGLVFGAMAVEYYPRLASQAHSRKRSGMFVSQEINILLLVLVPIVAAMMCLRKPVVALLYSEEFFAALTFLTYMLVGMVFRATSWAMAFVILARGDGKVYMITESASVVVGAVLNITFYNYWGLSGMGISFVLWYLIYNIIVGGVYFGRYGLTLDKSVVVHTVYAMVVVTAVAVAMEMDLWLIAVVMSAISLTISAIGLKRIL